MENSLDLRWLRDSGASRFPILIVSIRRFVLVLDCASRVME